MKQQEVNNMQTLKELGFNAYLFEEDLFASAVRRNIKPEFWCNIESLLFIAYCIFPNKQRKFLI